jgi:hypothetical protein
VDIHKRSPRWPPGRQANYTLLHAYTLRARFRNRIRKADVRPKTFAALHKAAGKGNERAQSESAIGERNPGSAALAFL